MADIFVKYVIFTKPIMHIVGYEPKRIGSQAIIFFIKFVYITTLILKIFGKKI